MTKLKYPALLLLLVCVLVSADSALAQDPAPKHEFRAAWVASVTNLDWPVRGATTESQQQHLISILDGLKDVGINAVIFQVRPEADALYESEIEPWSYWLTGEQGKAPEPFYDPLALAIEEAHKRGMELHAWFNPYRAERQVGAYSLDEAHIAAENPDWTFAIGSPAIRVLDPGLPQVREHVTNVIMDVVRRYDIDGVHFDDYFYPYPPNQITNEDDDTFAEYNRGFADRGDWRRDNINLLISMVNDSINAAKPHVKFGVSPFGIWRSGVPPGTSGLDAYSTIYADAVAWLDEQSLDYVTPQLYWKFGGGQDYGALANWWASVRNDRHLYPGIGAYKSDGATFWNPSDYSADEVPRQVRYNRSHDEIQGSVFFRSSNLTRYASKGLADSLRQNLFTQPALTPPMEWKSMVAPPAPTSLGYQWSDEDTTVVEISWAAGEAVEGAVSSERFAVYRVYSEDAPDFAEVVADAQNLIAVTGETVVRDQPATQTAHYFVTAVSYNSVESSAETSITLEGRATSSEGETPAAFQLHQNYPNPFNPTTNIRYSVETAGPVSLTVYDVMGREVAVLQEGILPPGSHTVEFDGRDVASGTYLYVLETEGQRQTRSMVLLK